MTAHLDLRGALPRGRLVIEASAGTGKTYSLSALLVRNVAELDRAASSLLVVTFTNAAAAELRDRSRRALVEALEVLDAGAAPADSWMQVLLEGTGAERADRRRRLAQAIASFDDATITTIHGFCQQALRQLGIRSGMALNSSLVKSSAELIDEVCRDLMVASMLDDATVFSWKAAVTPSDVLSSLKAAVTAMLSNPGATTLPAPDDLSADAPDSLTRWLQLVQRAVAEVYRRRLLRNEQGFDDLVTGLRDAIVDPVDGDAVVTALNERYQLVMVDEFQDTDAVQWQIFDRGFTGDMVLVGDPKQAIYRFRGADVHAYLAATADRPTVQLATNYRSDRDLVAATNSLLEGVALGDERIAPLPVDSAPAALDRSLRPGAPLVVRRVPSADGALVAAGDARKLIVDDLVGMVIDLLDHHEFDDGAKRVPVTPDAIAVLVPTHSNAELVVRGLLAAGIPAVRTRTGSVFETRAADEWVRLLAAVERPSSSASVRAAALGAFFGRAASALDPMSPGSDEQVADLQRRCAQWAVDLAVLPFLAWYDRVRADSGVVATLLARPGGERDLTDLDHIAELLAAELRGTFTSAASARRALERLRGGSADADERDPQMRRIDSDADAVQVTTLHASKGLEYPIVLMPFSWPERQPKDVPVYHDTERGHRVIDIAGDWEWSAGLETSDVREHHSYIEHFGDQLRLLYVGLTRARNRTVVWWAPSKDVKQSALSTLLLDRDDDGAPVGRRPGFTEKRRRGGGSRLEPAKTATVIDDESVAQVLDTVADNSGGLIESSVCSLVSSSPRWSGPSGGRVLDPLAVADAGDRVVIDPSWRRWSFSSLSRTRHHAHGSADDQAPVVGGADEPANDPDPSAASSNDVPPGATADAGDGGDGGVGPPVPLADVIGGRAFGNLVHAVLEVIDPASSTLVDDLSTAVRAALERDRSTAEPDRVVEGLAAAIRSPLGPLFDGWCLGDIAVSDRLAELAFDLPLGGTTRRVPSRQIGAVLLDTLDPDDPQRPYAEQLAGGRFTIEMAGYLQGSIDAVLRIRDASSTPRFVVVDYKTNRLHDRGATNPLAAYHPDRLPAAMAHHDYPLQALLYSVALHRYLRWRLPGYDPARHLGGIAYLFVRGMVGPDTPIDDGRPYGVFSWVPPVATIESLDRLLATGGVS